MCYANFASLKDDTKKMQRRTFPSVLLYSFGLTLIVSLLFNGFLLYEKSHQRNLADFESTNSVYLIEHSACQQQLSACEQACQQKDSLIRRLEHGPNAPPGQALTIQGTPSK